MEATENLAAAIREISELSNKPVPPRHVLLDVTDGDGEQNRIPIVVLKDEDKEVVRSLLPELKAAQEYAEQSRLLRANGPDDRRGTAQHQSLQSFIDHANRFKAENSAVWANPADRKLVSVLDYHPAGAASEARWGRHRGVYPCPLSEAWVAWGGGKEITLDQDDFAALLDSRDRELVGGTLPSGRQAPDPASLISLASKLEVYSTATAKRERDPNTGRVRISYAEDKGMSGDVLPPPSFLILIPVFEDGEPAPLEVRLRVTVEDGTAQFRVQIHAATNILRGAFLGLCERVKAETGLPLFVGTPE